MFSREDLAYYISERYQRNFHQFPLNVSVCLRVIAEDTTWAIAFYGGSVSISFDEKLKEGFEESARVSVNESDLNSVVVEELTLQELFLLKKITVEGDLNVVQQWSSLLQAYQAL